MDKRSVPYSLLNLLERYWRVEQHGMADAEVRDFLRAFGDQCLIPGRASAGLQLVGTEHIRIREFFLQYRLVARRSKIIDVLEWLPDTVISATICVNAKIGIRLTGSLSDTSFANLAIVREDDLIVLVQHESSLVWCYSGSTTEDICIWVSNPTRSGRVAESRASRQPRKR
jgi:hypothetical protein